MDNERKGSDKFKHAGHEHKVLELLRDIQGNVVALHLKLNAMEKRIMATLDETLAKVTEEDTDIDSVLALVTGLKQQLADALSGASLPPAVQAKVDAVFNQASASANKIVEALAANTPTP